MLTGGGSDDLFSFAAPEAGAMERDTITDLDLAEGDWIVFNGFPRNFFSDKTDPDNALQVYGSTTAVVHDLDDLREIVAHDNVSAVGAGDGSTELRFDLDGNGSADWLLLLEGISGIGEDRAEAAGNLDLQGTAANELFEAVLADDRILARAGDDWLYGSAGTDMLYGNAGSDAIYGGLDNDTLSSGTGSDLMQGGAGGDIFVIRAQDLADGDTDVILDLDFSEGDVLMFTGNFPTGFFDAAGPAVSPMRGGTMANVSSPEGLSALLALDTVSARGGPDGTALTLDLGTVTWSLWLDGITGIAGATQSNAAIGQTMLAAAGPSWTPAVPETPVTERDPAADPTPVTLTGSSSDDQLAGAAGADQIMGAGGSDHLTGNRGGDVFLFNGAQDEYGAVDLVADLNFGEGDVLLFGGFFPSGFFDGPAVTGLQVLGGGSIAQVSSASGLEALAGLDGVSASALPDGGLLYGFDLDGVPGAEWHLALRGTVTDTLALTLADPTVVQAIPLDLS